MTDAPNTLESTDTSGRQVLTFLAPPRVTSMWGNGRLVYVIDDGWAGIVFDGENRIDEYPVEHVDLEPALVAAAIDALPC